MGFGSIWHWVIVLLIILILFGRGRVAEIMGDFGKGIKSFKTGMNEGEKEPDKDPPAQIAAPPASPAKDSETSKSDQA